MECPPKGGLIKPLLLLLNRKPEVSGSKIHSLPKCQDSRLAPLHSLSSDWVSSIPVPPVSLLASHTSGCVIAVPVDVLRHNGIP